MGQQISDQTQLVINKLPEKVAKHVTLVRESGSLTYEEFLGRVAELNDVTAKIAAGQEKHLLFEVQPGSDSSAFWKVVVRVVCTKINKSSGIVEASRIMNLYQFIQLYKDITSQAAGVLAQSSTSEEPDGNPSSVTSCQASLWMGRVKQLTDEEECCICMDGRADLILPCAHSFCQKCIDKCSTTRKGRWFPSHHCPRSTAFYDAHRMNIQRVHCEVVGVHVQAVKHLPQGDLPAELLGHSSVRLCLVCVLDETQQVLLIHAGRCVDVCVYLERITHCCLPSHVRASYGSSDTRLLCWMTQPVPFLGLWDFFLPTMLICLVLPPAHGSQA
uniref:RING finger protein 141 n=1 Tax=Rattus norvegicus TaxID=10116 RepID=A0ABK0KX93_RAT